MGALSLTSRTWTVIWAVPERAGLPPSTAVSTSLGVGAQPVGAHSISAHVGVLRALQGEARGHRGRLSDAQGAVSGGEARGVVIQIQDLHFQAEELQGVLCHHLHRQHAAGSCSAQTLAVQPLAHHQRAAVQAHGEVAQALLGAQAQPATWQLLHLQAQVPGHVPHHGSQL
uniref:Uncharacterized protein n=1 Tax=Zosterops lateralis melanops TaxID=1220523 RepID=A0A8D2NVJ8_ZOSLA